MRIKRNVTLRSFEVDLDAGEWARLEAGDPGIARDLNAVATVGWSGVVRGPGDALYEFDEVEPGGLFGVKEEQ